MKKLIAANWKMYKTGAEAAEILSELAGILNGTSPEGRSIVVFAPFTALEKASESIAQISGATTGAENIYPAEEGAFTGEISARRTSGRIRHPEGIERGPLQFEPESNSSADSRGRIA